MIRSDWGRKSFLSRPPTIQSTLKRTFSNTQLSAPVYDTLSSSFESNQANARLLRWSREGFFKAPSFSQSGHNSSSVRSVNLDPFRYTMSFTVHGDVFVSLSVSHLLFGGCPAAIRWKIVSIVVNTIKTVFRAWAFAYILSEVLKGMKPSFADFYSTPAVILISPSLLVITTAFHTTPFSEKPRLRSTMCYRGLRSSFFLQASTTLRVPATQVEKCRRGLAAALASAYGSLSFHTKDSQTTKNSSDDVTHSDMVA
jgi:hypothetical protein